MVLNEIIAVPLCGFANRLKFLASIHGIAKKLKIKTVKVVWRSSMDCNLSHSDVFKSIRTMTFISDDDLPPKHNIMYYGYVHMNEIMATLDEDLQVEENKNKTSLLIEGGHESKHPEMSLIEFLRHKQKFYKSICWSAAIEKQLKQFSNESFPKVGFHYRHVNKETDEADVKANTLIDFSYNSPFNIFEEMMNKFKQPFFFISNSFYHKKYVEENCKKGVVIHIEDSNNRSLKESMLKSVIEFILLSRCEVIIGSYYSSFSDEPSYFNFSSKVMPISPCISDNQNNLQYFTKNYHSVLKPVSIDKYIVLNPNHEHLTTYFN